MKRAAGPILGLVLLAYPLVFSTPFAQRLGALVLLYAVGASAWNIVGGYAGLISVGHAVFFGCGATARSLPTSISACRRSAACRSGSS